MSRRNKLTLEDHFEIAYHTRMAEEHLWRIDQKVSNSEPKSNKGYKYMEKALDNFMHLRSELENNLDHMDEKFDFNKYGFIYYGNMPKMIPPSKEDMAEAVNRRHGKNETVITEYLGEVIPYRRRMTDDEKHTEAIEVVSVFLDYLDIEIDQSEITGCAKYGGLIDVVEDVIDRRTIKITDMDQANGK